MSSKEQRLLEAWRTWQNLLVTAPCSKHCSDYENTICRLLDYVPGLDEWDCIDAEAIHRAAFENPAERPTLLS